MTASLNPYKKEYFFEELEGQEQLEKEMTTLSKPYNKEYFFSQMNSKVYRLAHPLNLRKMGGKKMHLT